MYWIIVSWAMIGSAACADAGDDTAASRLPATSAVARRASIYAHQPLSRLLVALQAVRLGDPIERSAEQFERVSKAFFAELEARSLWLRRARGSERFGLSATEGSRYG
jgi:hypothetical protein